MLCYKDTTKLWKYTLYFHTCCMCILFRISYLSDGTIVIWKKKWNHKRLMIEIGSMVSYRGLGGRIDGTNKWLMLRRHKTPPQLQQTEQALLIRGSFSNLTRSTVNKNCYSIHALTGFLVKKKLYNCFIYIFKLVCTKHKKDVDLLIILSFLCCKTWSRTIILTSLFSPYYWI